MHLKNLLFENLSPFSAILSKDSKNKIHMLIYIYIILIGVEWKDVYFVFTFNIFLSLIFKQNSENMYMNHAWWMQQHETLSSIDITPFHSTPISTVYLCKCMIWNLMWCRIETHWLLFFEVYHEKYLGSSETMVDHLMHNVPKWSDRLSKSCSKCCKIFKVCLTILGHYALKG